MERTDLGEGRVAALRRAVAAIEGRGGGAAAPLLDRSEAIGSVLPFGIAAVDRRLGSAGGLGLGLLHEVVCDETRAAGAAVGFAASLVARLLERRDGRALWITTREARREGGAPHAPGLAAFGLDPGRLVDVAVDEPAEALWACEEGLSCRAMPAVVAEIPGDPAALDLTATRRLALRAGADGGGSGRGLALLVRVGGAALPTAAATRWRVAPAPSRGTPDFAPGLGRPVFRLDLEKNRAGRLGRFDVEWNPHERCFAALPAHPVPAAAAARDRPAAAAGGGRVLRFDRGEDR